MRKPLIVTKHMGVPVIDSRDIAEWLGRRHTSVLKSLDLLVARLDNKDAHSFIESTYSHPYNGREERRYLLTQEACTNFAFTMNHDPGFKFHRAAKEAFATKQTT